MLEYFLTQLEGACVFQITGQDDRLTNYIKSQGIFTARNGWRVVIDKEPEINVQTRTIYLQGKDSKLNNKVDRHWGYSNKEIKEIVKNVNNALQEAVEAAKNWKQRVGFEMGTAVIVNATIVRHPLISLLGSTPNVIIIK